MRRVYFDHNATAPLAPAARRAMMTLCDEVGNPSSRHLEGRRARDHVEVARDRIAAKIGANAEALVFTSGGTEANQLGLQGLAHAARGRDPGRTRLLLSAIEHPSLFGAALQLEAEGFEVERIACDRQGRVDPEGVAAALDHRVAVVAVQLANHEIGTVQPIAAIAARAGAVGAALHVDAVQALGKIAVDVAALGADTLALSGHKIGAPAGVGALFVRPGWTLPPLIVGGHQERERRAGTENLLGIVGFGAAVEALARAESGLRDAWEEAARRLGAAIHGGEAPRVPTTSNVGFDGVDGSLLCEALDLEGFAVATGAACSSGSVRVSPVIAALGVAEPRQAVRLSFGATNSLAEVAALVALLPRLLHRIRSA